MFLLFLMFLLRKVPELDILRLGLHYIFAGCGLVELGNVKKNPGNVWKSFLTQMCKVPFIFCLFSLSLFFSSRYFSLALLYSRLWNFPTIFVLNWEDGDWNRTGKYFRFYWHSHNRWTLINYISTWGISPSFHHCQS